MSKPESTLIQLVRLWLTMDDRKRVNLAMLLAAVAGGWAIYTKPDVFGPWIQNLFSLADFQTWVIFCLGGLLLYNLSQNHRRREDQLERELAQLRKRHSEELLSLEQRIEKMEQQMVAQQANHDRVVSAIARQRDKCNREASHHRSAIAQLVVAAAQGGQGERAQQIIDTMDANLKSEGLRSLIQPQGQHGRRSTDEPITD